MPDQPQTVKRDLERPGWVRWAFVGVVVLAIVVVIVWWVTSDEKTEKTDGEPAAAARAPQEVWELCYGQTPEACRGDYIDGPCERCNLVTLLDTRSMLVRAVTPDGQKVHIEEGHWVQRDSAGEVIAEGGAHLVKLSDDLYHGTYTDPKSGETGSLLLRRK